MSASVESLPTTLAVLNRIFAREKVSYLQYLQDAWVWTDADGRAVWKEISRMIQEEQKMLQRLAELIVRRKGILAKAGFDERFSDSHFVALAHLMPRLVAYQRWLIAELEKDLALLEDAEASALGRELLEMKKRHLALLEELQQRYGAKPSPAKPSAA
ncbi:MAG: ferritin-like domain-containing protein [Gemmatales bacterium]|nr:ferritin-like domain-containing protein [Gemmatales bacterium]MDW8176546.1 ferritin-like domain-containing protein [Gemmatales bacterium]